MQDAKREGTHGNVTLQQPFMPINPLLRQKVVTGVRMERPFMPPPARPRPLRVFIQLAILVSLCVEIEAKKKSRKKGYRPGRFRHFGYWALILFFLLFTPVLYTFLRAMMKDPAIPGLIKKGVVWLRDQCFGFLGKATSPSSQQPRSSSSAETAEGRSRRRIPSRTGIDDSARSST